MPVPDVEKTAIVNLLSEFSQSENPMIRSLSLQRLQEWSGTENTTVNAAINAGLYDPESTVRASTVRVIQTNEHLIPQHRAILLSMLNDPNEDSMVKISASEALSKIELSEDEASLVNSVMVKENILQLSE